MWRGGGGARAAGNERFALMLEEACNYHAPTHAVAAGSADRGMLRGHLLGGLPRIRGRLHVTRGNPCSNWPVTYSL